MEFKKKLNIVGTASHHMGSVAATGKTALDDVCPCSSNDLLYSPELLIVVISLRPSESQMFYFKVIYNPIDPAARLEYTTKKVFKQIENGNPRICELIFNMMISAKKTNRSLSASSLASGVFEAWKRFMRGRCSGEDKIFAFHCDCLS